MDYNRLTISLKSVDLEEALFKPWNWILRSDYKHYDYDPIFLTKFGDWILHDPEWNLYYLDIIMGNMRKIASEISDLDNLIKDSDFRRDIFKEPFLEWFEKNNLLLETGQCYGLKQPQIIEGTLEIELLEPTHIVKYQSIMGKLHFEVYNKKQFLEWCKQTGYRSGGKPD